MTSAHASLMRTNASTLSEAEEKRAPLLLTPKTMHAIRRIRGFPLLLVGWNRCRCRCRCRVVGAVVVLDRPPPTATAIATATFIEVRLG